MMVRGEGRKLGEHAVHSWMEGHAGQYCYRIPVDLEFVNSIAGCLDHSYAANVVHYQCQQQFEMEIPSCALKAHVEKQSTVSENRGISDRLA